MNSPGLKEVRPGPVAILSTGTSRFPFWPAITQVARAAISAGTLSAAGDALQRLPASDALPCTWVDPIRLAASTTPGQARCRASLTDQRPGCRRPDDKTALVPANARDARDLLDIDNEVRLGPAGAKLNQQIGPARQDLRTAGGFGQKTHGLSMILAFPCNLTGR